MPFTKEGAAHFAKYINDLKKDMQVTEVFVPVDECYELLATVTRDLSKLGELLYLSFGRIDGLPLRNRSSDAILLDLDNLVRDRCKVSLEQFCVTGWGHDHCSQMFDCTTRYMLIRPAPEKDSAN